MTVDLDDTLWDLRAVMMRAETEVMACARGQMPDAVEHLSDRAAWMELRQSQVRKDPSLRRDLSRLRLMGYVEMLQKAGMDAEAAKAGADRLFKVYRRWRNSVDLFEGAEQVLTELSARFNLGALTNGNAELGCMGLAHFFNFSVNAFEAGYMKPDPAIFLAAARAAACPPDEMVHIGDDPELDVHGARAVGMTAIWFNRYRHHWHSEGAEPPQVHSWSEVPALLATLSS